MPCNDVTEVLELHFDPQDRLASYSLTKRSCGRAVGEETLVLDWARGQTLDQLLARTIDEFLAAHPCAGETEEFLHLKHFFAIRSGLEVLSGRESGGAKDPCAVDSIDFGPGGTLFIARLSVDMVTDRIRACGRCAGCVSPRKT